MIFEPTYSEYVVWDEMKYSDYHQATEQDLLNNDRLLLQSFLVVSIEFLNINLVCNLRAFRPLFKFLKLAHQKFIVFLNWPRQSQAEKLD